MIILIKLRTQVHFITDADAQGLFILILIQIRTQGQEEIVKSLSFEDNNKLRIRV